MSNRYREVTLEELLRICADLDDSEAWDELIGRVHGMVFGIVRRTGLRYAGFQLDLCDDLEQSVYLHLAGNNGQALRRFIPQHPGSGFGYVKKIAAHVAHDCMRSKGFGRLPGSGEDLPDRGKPDKTEAVIFTREIDTFLRENVSERDRQIFWLHHLQRMTAKEIAAIPAFGLTEAGVESVLGRFKRLIKEKFGPGKGK